MVDLIINGGVVVTVNEDREILTGGGIVVDDGNIVEVTDQDDIDTQYDAERTIDATGKVILPGFINTHTHVADILLRGGGSTDRPLYDWLFNIIKPARAEMTPEEHAIASALYTSEAVTSGITTFVENAVGGGSGYGREIIEAKFDVYGHAGIRNIYGQSFIDAEMESELKEYVELVKQQEPDIKRPPDPRVSTDEALDNIESLIQDYHEGPEGRQSVWPAPLSPRSTTVDHCDGLRGSYSLAEEYDVMTTTHVSETTHEEQAVGGDHYSMTEYLNKAGYLGERSLLGHCVHLTERDIQLLKTTDTRVAHNMLSNLALGSGIAPIPTMLHSGVTVAMGTDNASCSDTVNMLNDIRYAALVQKGVHEQSDIVSPESVLEMATINAAHAIGRGDDLGSLEVGKKADMIVLDLDCTHTTPHPDTVAAIVYQTQGPEVETVVCDGEVVVEDRVATGLDELYDNLTEKATKASKNITERTGISHVLEEQAWKSG